MKLCEERAVSKISSEKEEVKQFASENGIHFCRQCKLDFLATGSEVIGETEN
jgi:hypothetical protein